MLERTQTECEPISAQVLPNTIQVGIVLVATMLPAIIKRRFFERPVATRRSKEVWRFDVRRGLMASVIGICVIIVFARGLNGNVCSNFLALVAVDLSIGTALEAFLCYLFKKGGMRLGYYGAPPEGRRFAAQTLAYALLSVALRSFAACVGTLAIAVSEAHDAKIPAYTAPWFYYYTCLPGVYIMARYIMLDGVTTYKVDYERVQAPTINSAVQLPTKNPVHVIGEVDVDSDGSDGGDGGDGH